MRRALTFAVLLLMSAQSLRAGQAPLFQPPRDPVLQRGTGAISGRLVEAATGQPVRKARVRVSSAALRDGRTVYSDGSGAFEFSALPAGRYSVTANKIGWIPVAYGQAHLLEAGAPIDVTDAKTTAGINLTMSRAGVIAGRVTDEYGEPVTDTIVSAVRYQSVNNTRRLVSSGNRATNDLGEFRIFTLTPGQYYLTATWHPGPDQDSTQQTYAPIFYPGTANVADAQLLTLAAGQTLVGMNLTLIPARPVTVSGTVTDSQGRVPRQFMVAANSRPGSPGNGRPGGVASDGTFRISGLAAGEYILRARSGNGSPDSESAAMPLSVGSSDVSDIHIVTAPPTIVTGRVHVDPQELGSLKGSTFHLSTPPATPDEIGISGGTTTVVKDDFTFELKIPPGRVFIRSNTAGWFLRAVKINGVDIIDSGVDIQPNGSLSGVEIELTHKQPELAGMITNAAGEPTRSGFIVVFPQNPTHWGYLSRYVRTARPNPDSKYRILVPPGDYYAVALETLDPGQVGDAEFLMRIREHAATISLSDGDHKTLDLKLLSSSPQ